MPNSTLILTSIVWHGCLLCVPLGFESHVTELKHSRYHPDDGCKMDIIKSKLGYRYVSKQKSKR
jgi:hypothetical protein